MGMTGIVVMVLISTITTASIIDTTTTATIIDTTATTTGQNYNQSLLLKNHQEHKTGMIS